MLLAEEAGLNVADIPMPTYRAPVRPLPLRVLYADDEPQITRDDWTGWFGYERQWRQDTSDEAAELRTLLRSRDIR